MFRFAIIGGGWRAEFFARVAQYLPERFKLIGSWMRDSYKCRVWSERFGGKAAASIDELMAFEPEFVVVSLPANVQVDLLEKLLTYGIPLLLETPLGRDLDTLERVRRICNGKEQLVQTAEQYLEWPLYRAWNSIISEGLIGEPYSLTLSALHGYHAASVMRAFLGTGMQKCSVVGRHVEHPIVHTGDRSGIVHNGFVNRYGRDMALLTFENGKDVLYDFSGEQYHSLIRSRRVLIDGEKGQIEWDKVRYINPLGKPVEQKIERVMFGVNDNSFLGLAAITLGDRYLYENPFGHVRLNDDEIAVAMIMDKTGRKSRGEHIEAYSFADSMRDAEIAALMTKACENPGKVFEG